jgi:hypothetical protein
MPITKKFIAISKREIALPKKFIAISKREMPITKKVIAISFKEIAAPKRFIAISERKIAAPKKFIAFSEREIAITKKVIVISVRMTVTYLTLNLPAFNRGPGNRKLEPGNQLSQSFGCSKMTFSAIGQIVPVKGRCRRSKRDRGDGCSYVLRSDSADPLIFRCCLPNR